jgi:hypothetical protein
MNIEYGIALTKGKENVIAMKTAGLICIRVTFEQQISI